MDEIFIHDLLIRSVIGISEREREQPQDILVNITLFADTAPAGRSDDLNLSINYRSVAKKVLAHCEVVHRYTVEALAEDIADFCLNEFGVSAVTVMVEKPGAVRFAQSVGVKIHRTRI